MRIPFLGAARRAVAPLLSVAVVAAALLGSVEGGHALAASPAFAAAPPASPTMLLSFRVFPSGDPVPNTVTASIPVAPGGSISLTAPDKLFGGSPQRTFDFAFWDINAALGTTPVATFTAPTGTATFHATAWYFQEGVGGSCDPGACRPGVTTYAFSLNQDKVLSTTPIASVTPAGAWAGPPSTTVSTTTSSSPVVITARGTIGGSGRFSSWLKFGSGTVAGTNLTVPPSGSSLAIAFYGIPVPDPCDDIRTALDNISRNDFTNEQAYLNAVHALVAQLRSCQQQYGGV